MIGGVSLMRALGLIVDLTAWSSEGFAGWLLPRRWPLELSAGPCISLGSLSRRIAHPGRRLVFAGLDKSLVPSVGCYPTPETRHSFRKYLDAAPVITKDTYQRQGMVPQLLAVWSKQHRV